MSLKSLTSILPLLILISAIGCAKEEPAAVESVVEWIKAPDPQTGYEVWQITTHDSGSAAFYFEKQSFTADDKYMVFRSNRSGSHQLYRVDLSSGEISQLTDMEKIRSANMHPDGIHCLFSSGANLFKVNVHTRKIETVFDAKGKFPNDPWWAGSYSMDGNNTVVSFKSSDSTALYQVNLASGAIKKVLVWEQRYSHPQICPGDADLITFVPWPDTQNDMTLPMEKRARTWIVDARTGKTKQYLTMPYGFRATHESWNTDGSRLYFFKKTQPGWVPTTICSIDRAGGDWQEHYTHPALRLGHGFTSKDGHYFVSDGQDPDHNPIIIVDLKTGEGKILCWPNSSIREGHNKQAHVHPNFSSSGKYVTYTSTVTGVAQVYVVPVPEDLFD